MKRLKLYSKLLMLPLFVFSVTLLTSCSKKDNTDTSADLTKKIISNYPIIHGPIQIPTKISSYAGPCIASGGWCVDMPVLGNPDPILSGYALSTLGYDPANPGNMLIHFDEYYPGDNLNNISNYTVEADHALPVEASMELTGLPNTTVLRGTYPLGTSAEGKRYVVVATVSK